jgi:hypothetical protein
LMKKNKDFYRKLTIVSAYSKTSSKLNTMLKCTTSS